MPGVVNKLIRKSLYSENEIFPFEGINLGEDYVTTPKLIAKARRISKVNKPLYHYIQYNEGSYTAVMNQKAIDDLWFVLNELYNYFKSTKEFSLLKNDLLKGQLIKKLDVSWYRDWETDRKSTRLNSSHSGESRMPSAA